MHWIPLLRAVNLPRRHRREQRTVAPIAAVGNAGPRHPAMAGLNVPPVHGRHCICERCERDASTAA